MKSLGFTAPFFHVFPVPQYVGIVREAEARGYDAAWITETASFDALTIAATLAAATMRMRIGTGVLPVGTRSPVLLGMTAATLGRLAPRRAILGLGVSSRTIIEDWHGVDFERPLARLREAVDVIRLVQRGDRVKFIGEFYHVKNFRLGCPPPYVPVPIYVAALGPRALEAAGEIADGVLLDWLSPDSARGAIGRIEEGARTVGRTLDQVEVVAYVRTCVTDDPAAARDWLARDLVSYCLADGYARQFRRSGFAADVDRVQAAWNAGDRAGAARAISRGFIDSVSVIGPADFCRERLEAFADAGVTLPVVYPFAPDGDARLSLLRTLRAFR